MRSIDQYVSAATRDHARRSYRAAIRHFEETWGGFLPATADAVARYLADHAETLSLNTLRLRLAALAQWHWDQGFPDPTKAPLVQKVLKGIGELHPSREKQARLLQPEQLGTLVAWMERAFVEADQAGRSGDLQGLARDRALFLIGFWRGFRADELCRLQVEYIDVIVGEGMVLYLPRSKSDHSARGREHKAPALSRLCPASAYLYRVHLAHLKDGPVFPPIDRWGNVGENALRPGSLVPLLRERFRQAGIVAPEQYSGHSLRRGFATWANANQWDVKDLMGYVGWKDIRSAMRYIDRADPFARHRIESHFNHPGDA
jgi:integrase